MAKKCMLEREVKRKRMAKTCAGKRDAVRARALDKKATIEERFAAQLELSKLPRNGSKIRQRNRCGLTGRSRGNYRKFNLSRIALRQLGNQGKLPGLTKSSW
jgi:small subunit ribosomal protein S14